MTEWNEASEKVLMEIIEDISHGQLRDQGVKKTVIWVPYHAASVKMPKDGEIFMLKRMNGVEYIPQVKLGDCICNKPNDRYSKFSGVQKLIQCSGMHQSPSWWHWECAGIPRGTRPEGAWYCAECIEKWNTELGIEDPARALDEVIEDRAGTPDEDIENRAGTPDEDIDTSGRTTTGGKSKPNESLPPRQYQIPVVETSSFSAAAAPSKRLLADLYYDSSSEEERRMQRRRVGQASPVAPSRQTPSQVSSEDDSSDDEPLITRPRRRVLGVAKKPKVDCGMPDKGALPSSSNAPTASRPSQKRRREISDDENDEDFEVKERPKKAPRTKAVSRALPSSTAARAPAAVSAPPAPPAPPAQALPAVPRPPPPPALTPQNALIMPTLPAPIPGIPPPKPDVEGIVMPPWSLYEGLVTRELLLGIKSEGRVWHTEGRWREVDQRMWDRYRIRRPWSGIKNYWQRYGRVRFNFYEQVRRQTGAAYVPYDAKFRELVKEVRTEGWNANYM